MKKYLILSAFVIVGSFGTWAHSTARGPVFVQKVAENDGNTVSDIGVACSSSSWTTVLPVSPTRRVAQIMTLVSSDIVCLSSATYGTCTVTRSGAKLQATLEYDHASEALLYCRTLDTKPTVYVFGLDYTDSGDNTSYP